LLKNLEVGPRSALKNGDEVEYETFATTYSDRNEFDDIRTLVVLMQLASDCAVNLS
jgi:hypothetical protein